LKDRMALHQWDDADEADFLKGQLQFLALLWGAPKVGGVRKDTGLIEDDLGLYIALGKELDKIVKFQESKVSVYLNLPRFASR